MSQVRLYNDVAREAGTDESETPRDRENAVEQTGVPKALQTLRDRLPTEYDPYYNTFPLGSKQFRRGGMRLI